MHMQACTRAQKRNTHDTHTLHTQLIHVYIHKHHKSYTCKLSFAQTQSRRCRSKLKLWRSLHTYSDLFGRLNLCSSCIAFRHDLQVLKIIEIYGLQLHFSIIASTVIEARVGATYLWWCLNLLSCLNYNFHNTTIGNWMSFHYINEHSTPVVILYLK